MDSRFKIHKIYISLVISTEIYRIHKAVQRNQLDKRVTSRIILNHMTDVAMEIKL